MEFHDHFSQELALQQHQQQNVDDDVSDQSMNFSVKLSQQYGDDVNNKHNNNNNNSNVWDQSEKYKADILNHHLSEQLLSAHVACLRIATPVDQLPRIDEQLTESQNLVAKYYVVGQSQRPLDDKELDQFMGILLLLRT
ncbi:hypothetical protein KY290_011564 [Solanum tuberosum]|uniref:KNOX1 domain-containing protein n=1 Tax=Solanum tuberosum TaxID=4113 RepID=A0ABQ7W122_SOLTU|nr:hypothetical protein KY290_011564 [Solanum tuberosum]